MKFTRTITVTRVRRKIVLTGVRCPRCGCELEAAGAEKIRKLPPGGDKGGKGK